MRVLVIGSGGREHALCWAIAGSPILDKLWCAPGNPGTAQVAENVAMGVLEIPSIVAFALDNQVDLVVVGPEAPLVAGLADELAQEGIPCFGPSAAAAQLEGSKTFTKEVADAAGIPTAKWERFDEADAAREFIRRRGAPIVVKADGLAAGKGVVVATTEAEALAAIDMIMEEKTFGATNTAVVIEECLLGEEVSLFALCDGKHALLFGAAQDHKRVGDGDTGPNTGGMGAYSPPPCFPPEAQEAAMASIIRPALAEMAKRGTPFKGVLFAGLMLTDTGPKLIEFNVRFGDPECQALLPRLKSDLLPALLAAHDGELHFFDLRWDDALSSVAVVMAAQGYPGDPKRGGIIRALDQAAAKSNAQIFHSGTTQDADGTIRAYGGRVLTICATGKTISAARDAAYSAIEKIDWPDGFCRHDIGWRAL
ncbi:MAG: phosphoribosylamine--glycine ligase [Acetobacteraceae bacterium]|nr:phosphoribosylamine--glycine ligase [Acetobacteraceae bacterium]